MTINGFIWLEDIVDKLWSKHNVDPGEVVALFHNQPYFRFAESGHRPGENVYAALGQTDGGRYLIAFFVLKRDGRALIVSARNMTAAERRQYERR